MDNIQSAYKALGKTSFYDGMITCSTFSGKVITRLIWDMSKEENTEYITKALSALTDDFSGRLLEVPVGTGILTMPVYANLKNADITCLDYSAEMMGWAKKRADAMNIGNVKFQQGDVGALPFDDEAFDVVLSLNGFHAFPDKEAAYHETYRVLKKGGMIAVDGTVVSGQAVVNESSMTGEPLPVLKKEGATVFAGTVIEEG